MSLKDLQTPWDSDNILMVDMGCFERGCMGVANDWAAGQRPECVPMVEYSQQRPKAYEDGVLDAMKSIRELIATEHEWFCELIGKFPIDPANLQMIRDVVKRRGEINEGT